MPPFWRNHETRPGYFEIRGSSLPCSTAKAMERNEKRCSRRIGLVSLGVQLEVEAEAKNEDLGCMAKMANLKPHQPLIVVGETAHVDIFTIIKKVKLVK